MKRKNIIITLTAIIIAYTLSGCGYSEDLKNQVAEMQEEINKQASEMQEEISQKIEHQTEENSSDEIIETFEPEQSILEKSEAENGTEVEENSATEEENGTPKNDSSSDVQEETTVEDEIENAIRDRITDKYIDTDIESITLNEDLGTDVDGDYVALVHLTWNVLNSAKMSKEMIQLYSEDLAATVAESCPNVQELAIFWKVPYLNNANAKCSYERKDDGMYEMDTAWSGFN